MEGTAAAREGPEEAPRTETYHYSAASNPALEDQLFELVRLSDIPMSKQLFDVVVELLRLNVPPSAVLHVMKTMRAQATHSTLPPSLQTTRVSSRAHTPPSSSESGSTSRPHTETTKQAQRKTAAAIASKPSVSQQPSGAEKSSRKHRNTNSSNSGIQKTSSRSSEKLRSSTKGGSSSGSAGKTKGHTAHQDPPKKVG